MRQVTKLHCHKFCDRTSRYAAFYEQAGLEEVTHKDIEKFVKKSKNHRSALDQDFAYLTKVLEGIFDEEEGGEGSYADVP